MYGRKKSNMSKRLLFQAFSIFLFIMALGGVLYFEQYFVLPRMGEVFLEDKTVIMVDVARTAEEQEKGLSGREELDYEHGLLFVYNRYAEPNFWMKDMLFPIDIIWIQDERIVGFEENIQPEYPPTTIYSPDFPVDAVLEVKTGFIKYYNLEINDQLDIRLNN